MACTACFGRWNARKITGIGRRACGLDIRFSSRSISMTIEADPFPTVATRTQSSMAVGSKQVASLGFVAFEPTNPMRAVTSTSRQSPAYHPRNALERHSGNRAQLALPRSRAFRLAFPNAADLIGAVGLRGLAACSGSSAWSARPHSIFARLTTDFVRVRAALPDHEVLQRTTVRLIEMTSRSLAAGCRLRALAPPRQMTSARSPLWFGPDAFGNQTAMVVGGSRGLGELTAKTIARAAGGSSLTYSVAAPRPNEITPGNPDLEDGPNASSMTLQGRAESVKLSVYYDHAPFITLRLLQS